MLGEDEDPVQAGGLCVKAEMMTQLVYNRFRLTTPLKRGGRKGSTDSKFEPFSWDEALDHREEVSRPARRRRGAGHREQDLAADCSAAPGRSSAASSPCSASPNDTDVGPVCNDAGGDALGVTFGMGNFTNGYGKDENTGKEDLGSAKYFLFFGTNQAETHPVTFAYLLRVAHETKAKLVVVDPRLTPTGAQADDWIAPKPHTDLALALAMLQHVIAQKLYDAKFVAKWVLGFDELKKHLADNGYTPEWAEKVTDVPAVENQGDRGGLCESETGGHLLQCRDLASTQRLRHLPRAGLPRRDHRQRRRQRRRLQFHAQHLAGRVESARRRR